MVIAIDGPAASGKGTLARRLAAHLGCPHLDTGLLYRAVALGLIQNGEPVDDEAFATRAARELRSIPADDGLLRGRNVGDAASVLSAFPPVRDALLAFQRSFADQPGGAVLDGRDIGTVVCPDAAVKLYVTASPEERARRRVKELEHLGESAPFATVLAEIRRRDERDRNRAAAPLTVATDATIIDTTELDASGAFDRALAIVRDAARLPLAGES